MSTTTKTDEGDFSPEYSVAHTNYPFDTRGFTDHQVEARTADCFCEPTLRTDPGPINGIAGPFIIITHQPIVRQSGTLFHFFDPITRFLDGVSPIPAEGWDAVMDRERIDELISIVRTPAIRRVEAALDPLIQRPDESFDAFSTRIRERQEFLATSVSNAAPIDSPTKAQDEPILTQSEFEERMLKFSDPFADLRGHEDVEILSEDTEDPFDDDDEYEFTIEDEENEEEDET